MPRYLIGVALILSCSIITAAVAKVANTDGKNDADGIVSEAIGITGAVIKDPVKPKPNYDNLPPIFEMVSDHSIFNEYGAIRCESVPMSETDDRIAYVVYIDADGNTVGYDWYHYENGDDMPNRIEHTFYGAKRPFCISNFMWNKETNEVAITVVEGNKDVYTLYGRYNPETGKVEGIIENGEPTEPYDEETYVKVENNTSYVKGLISEKSEAPTYIEMFNILSDSSNMYGGKKGAVKIDEKNPNRYSEQVYLNENGEEMGKDVYEYDTEVDFKPSRIIHYPKGKESYTSTITYDDNNNTYTYQNADGSIWIVTYENGIVRSIQEYTSMGEPGETYTWGK